MKRRLLFFSLAGVVFTAALLAGCSNTPPGTSPALSAEVPVTVNVAGLKGPSGIGMVNLMNKSKKGEAQGSYNFTIEGAPDAITAKLISGELDIAALPTNSALMLFNRSGGQVQLAALNTLGVLYMVENGETVKETGDLRGKRVIVSGQGTVTEYILNYILSANGLDPAADVTVEWKSEHSEVASLLGSGQADIAILPEPFVTAVQNTKPELRTALSLTEEWDKAAAKNGDTDSVMSMGCIAVRTEFAKANKAAVDTFLREYSESVEAVKSDIDGTGALCAEYELLQTAEIAKKAIPNCNIVYVDGDDMKRSIQGFYETLFELAPQSVGGKLPTDDFYYAK